MPTRPQPYTKNRRQPGHGETRSNILLRERAPQLVIQDQTVSPGNMHTSDTKQGIFMYSGTCIMVTTIIGKEGVNLPEIQERFVGRLQERKGRRNDAIIL